MTHLPCHPDEAARFPALRRLLGALAQAIAANFEARARARRARRRVGRIEHLDDRILKDIGLTRTDLDRARHAVEGPEQTLRAAALGHRRADLERPRLRARQR